MLLFIQPLFYVKSYSDRQTISDLQIEIKYFAYIHLVPLFSEKRNILDGKSQMSSCQWSNGTKIGSLARGCKPLLKMQRDF